MKIFPDHKSATEFAYKVLEDENPDVRNLGNAYLEVVWALRDSEETLGKIGRKIDQISKGVVSVGSFLGHADMFKKGKR